MGLSHHARIPHKNEPILSLGFSRTVDVRGSSGPNIASFWQAVRCTYQRRPLLHSTRYVGRSKLERPCWLRSVII
ncbi:hypothetical protein BKA56DRAFT_46303 [Ilyonectria sp. MPI-CAGE-AT-0026]|nr:hypothetical protein BKA56DRAFT_46303 [Ilyonectria sp. MPI-CAGE-AT-0026]